ncbi:MAG: hypothetical protein GX771_00465 [Halomonadaceae bacterium]|nr:hypothetical protein [Halomonadaceae bacterium]
MARRNARNLGKTRPDAEVLTVANAEVEAAVVALAELQAAGWFYIRA